MKIIPILLVATLLCPSLALAQVSPCGNNDPGGPGGQGSSNPSPEPSPSPTPGPCDPSRPKPDSGDPVLPFTGNEFKRVDDLRISGSPGQLGMLWSRHSNSRAVGGASLFGLAHYWRHSFQWELAPLSKDSTGRRRMELIYPDGARFWFVEVAPGDFQPLASLTDRLAERPDGFRLERKDGSQRIFKKRGTVAAPFYLMEEMRDPAGNAYLLEYNAARQVTKVTEPGGRFFRVDYRTLTGNRLNPSTLATLAAAPAPGQWAELPVTNPTAFRFVRLVQADKSFGQIAEVEFYEAGTGLKLAGQIISSDSAAAGQTALDGSTATSFVSSSQSGGFVGFDLGSPRKIGRVRFLSTTGREAVHKPSGWSQAAVRIEGANQAPVTTQAIASVQTDDGRSATYEYTSIIDPTLPYDFPALTSVLFSDGTRSTYQHVQVFPGTRPLVSEWNDVRYELRQGRYRTVYQNDTTGAVLGAVRSQVNLETGQPILTIGLLNNSLHRPLVTFAHGGKEARFYNTSLPTGAAITRTMDANNNATDYTYDSRGYMATKRDPLGRITAYTWTAQGQLLDKTHPDGAREAWTYNAAGYLTSHTDTLARTTTYTRDVRNLVTRVDYPDGTFESFQHNAFGQVTRHRHRNGGVSTYDFDATGLMTGSTDPLGNTTTYGYDAASRMNRVTDALGRTTAMEYNDRGLVTKITNPDGTTKIRTYTPYGDLASETNELGHTWTYTYDVFRRLTTTTDPLGRTIRTEYHPDSYVAMPLAVTDPAGVRTSFTYDSEWRLLRRTVAAGTPAESSVSFTYDRADNPLSATDAMSQTTRFAYDNRNRITTATDPLGNITRWTYDTESNVLSETRPDGGVTLNEYDTMDRMVKTTNPKGQITRLTYTASGSVASMTDPRGQTYTWIHDPLERPTRKTYPGGSFELYSYDAVGNPIAYTTRAGQIRTSVFDRRDREIQTIWSDATPDITRTFDAAGRVLSEDNGAVTLTYTYNPANQVLSETTQLTGQPARTVGYAYDAAGRLASTTYPGGNVVTQTYTTREESHRGQSWFIDIFRMTR